MVLIMNDDHLNASTRNVSVIKNILNFFVEYFLIPCSDKNMTFKIENLTWVILPKLFNPVFISIASYSHHLTRLHNNQSTNRNYRRKILKIKTS